MVDQDMIKSTRFMKLLVDFYGEPYRKKYMFSNECSNKIKEHLSTLNTTIGHYEMRVFIKFLKNLKGGVYKKYVDYPPSVIAISIEFKRINENQVVEACTKKLINRFSYQSQQDKESSRVAFLKLKEDFYKKTVANDS